MSKIVVKDLSDHSSRKKIKQPHPDLPQIPFTLSLIGPSRSGKSVVIRYLILEHYMKLFDYIFIFCPSVDLNDDFDKVVSKGFQDLEEYNPNSKKKHKLFVQKFNHFDQDVIEEIFNQQVDIIKTYGKKKSPQILIIFDDCFDDAKFTNSHILKTFAMRGRHAFISQIYSGQKLSLLNTTIRNNLTNLVMFRPANFNELQRLLEELVERKKMNEFSQKFKEIWSEPYSFIYIDYLNPNIKKRFMRGFGEEIDIEL